MIDEAISSHVLTLGISFIAGKEYAKHVHRILAAFISSHSLGLRSLIVMR